MTEVAFSLMKGIYVWHGPNAPECMYMEMCT